MKTLFTFIILVVFSLGVSAQLTKAFTFELAQADTGWYLFANGAEESPDDVSMSANPSKMEPNLSDSVLKFVVHADASPWAGIYTDWLEEPMAFTDDNFTLTMLVYKPLISPSCMKIEGSTDGGANAEVKVSNTLTDEWELLEFDMSAGIGHTYARLTVFPDFPDARSEESVNYMDNFSSPGAMVAVKHFGNLSLKIYPNPAEKMLFVQVRDMTGYTVSNLLGQSLKSAKFESVNSKFVDLNDLKTGVYFISVETGNGTYTSKFIKK